MPSTTVAEGILRDALAKKCATKVREVINMHPDDAFIVPTSEIILRAQEYLRDVRALDRIVANIEK